VPDLRGATGKKEKHGDDGKEEKHRG